MPACSHTLMHAHTNHTGTRIYKLQKDQRDQRVEHSTVVCVFTTPLPTIDKEQVFFYYCRNVADAKSAMKAASPRYYWHTHWFLFAWMRWLSFSIYALFHEWVTWSARQPSPAFIMLMFFSFSPQRAYIAHTKDGLRQPRNSPSLSVSLSDSLQTLWQSLISVARYSHFFCLMHTLTHWDSPTWDTHRPASTQTR